jgi:hypothetical protein
MMIVRDTRKQEVTYITNLTENPETGVSEARETEEGEMRKVSILPQTPHITIIRLTISLYPLLHLIIYYCHKITIISFVNKYKLSGLPSLLNRLLIFC